MPYASRRVHKRSYRKRSLRGVASTSRAVFPRRSRYRRKFPRRYRTPTEFPSSMRVKLRYTADVDLNVTADSGTKITYSMNSAFDPLYSFGGATCSGFSQWAGIYERYMVSGAKITFSGTATSNDNASLVVGIRSRPSSLPALADDAFYGDWLIESKSPCYRRLPKWVTPQPYPRFSLSKYFSVKRTEQISMLDDVHYGASTAADPANEAVIDVVASYTTGTGTCTIPAHVTITYYVKFYRPKVEADVAV